MEPLEGNWTTYGMLNPMLAVLGIKMSMELQRKQDGLAEQMEALGRQPPAVCAGCWRRAVTAL